MVLLLLNFFSLFSSFVCFVSFNLIDFDLWWPLWLLLLLECEELPDIFLDKISLGLVFASFNFNLSSRCLLLFYDFDFEDEEEEDDDEDLDFFVKVFFYGALTWDFSFFLDFDVD